MLHLRAWQSVRSQTNHAPSVYAFPRYCPAAKQCKEFYIILNLSGEKFTYGMAVVSEKCYFTWLRGTKEGQECASIRHFEIFSMSSVLEMSTKARVVNDSITSNCNSTRAGSDSDSDSRVFQNR